MCFINLLHAGPAYNCVVYSQTVISSIAAVNGLPLCSSIAHTHGPVTRYVNLWVAHAPGMPGAFSQPPTSKDTASYRFWYASRHVRDARAVIHVGVSNPGGWESVPGACTTRSVTYLVTGPWVKRYSIQNLYGIYKLIRLMHRLDFRSTRWDSGLFIWYCRTNAFRFQ